MHRILSIRPKEYPKAKVNCGYLSAKAILSAFGLELKHDPRPFLERVQGLTLPSSAVRILKINGVDAELKNARGLTEQERLAILEKSIDENRPIMLIIGGVEAAQWVTIWGRDDEKKTFFLYDSSKKTPPNQHIPIGNAEMTYDGLLSAWRGTPWLTYIFPSLSYLYIEILH